MSVPTPGKVPTGADTAPETEPYPDYPREAGTGLLEPVEPPSADEVVVPVRIVQDDAPYELRLHRLNNVVCMNGRQTQIAPRALDRVRLFLRNTHAADSITLAHEETEAGFMGYILPAGAELELFSNAPVFGTPSGANAITVSVAAEYVVEEDED